jgi:putative SOS response-associated peptidase YedK
MCNRYASDIRKAGLERDYYGFDEWSETIINTNLEVFPKSYAPVIRALPDGARELHKMRRGLPGLASTGRAPVTNIRNVQSQHWRRVLGVRHRCLVPSPRSVGKKTHRRKAKTDTLVRAARSRRDVLRRRLS